MTEPSVGEMLLGIEGLALLRLASGGDRSARRARVDGDARAAPTCPPTIAGASPPPACACAAVTSRG